MMRLLYHSSLWTKESHFSAAFYTPKTNTIWIIYRAYSRHFRMSGFWMLWQWLVLWSLGSLPRRLKKSWKMAWCPPQNGASHVLFHPMLERRILVWSNVQASTNDEWKSHIVLDDTEKFYSTIVGKIGVVHLDDIPVELQDEYLFSNGTWSI